MLPTSLIQRTRRGFAHGLRAPRRGSQPAFDALEGRQLLAITAFSAPLNPAPVEGASFTGVVARFTDSDPATDPSQFGATINWGDGRMTQGTISVDPTRPNSFNVTGTHTYQNMGSFRAIVQITSSDGDRATARTTNIVNDAPLTATGTMLNANPNRPLIDATVATFTSGNPRSVQADFFATIDWGDGQTSSGRIIPNRSQPGSFFVRGSHTYNAVGDFTVRVTIQSGAFGTQRQFFTPTNVIGEGVTSDQTNPAIVNPGSLVANPNGPWWINSGMGTSFLVDAAGNPNTSLPAVTVPGPAGSTGASMPTGIVFNNAQANPNNFVVQAGANSGASSFIFATEEGTISGWNPTVNRTNAILAVDNSDDNSLFRGLALLDVGLGASLPAGQYLFATDFRNGEIDVFNSNFQEVVLPAGAFQDPTIPAGFVPFGVQAINGNVFVTYARQAANGEDVVPGAGNGFVNVFNTSGTLIRRLGGQGTQTQLNAPFGVTQAPADFGMFGNAILVGNFGDSRVNAFDPNTGNFLGQLSDARNRPLTLNGGSTDPNTSGLMGLSFGNGGVAGARNTLFFTSGIDGQDGGLFGSLTPTTATSAVAITTVSVRPLTTQGGTTAANASFSSRSSLSTGLGLNGIAQLGSSTDTSITGWRRAPRFRLI
jgi:uncharacterized protein (TIGR03118 family)